MNTRGLFTVLFSVLLVPSSVDGLVCYSCQDVIDEAMCNSTQLCTSNQSCFKSTRMVNNQQVITQGCKNNDQCNIGIGNIIGKRQEAPCLECCSSDYCNAALCEHLKPSACLDDETIDCAHLNTVINLCNDIQHAKTICPKFCGLCNLVDGGWSSWSEWTRCAVTCDQGIIQRNRSCSNPAPANGGLNCTGDSLESKPCYTATPCPVDGNWSAWGSWGTCSTSCETGIQTRTRSCTNPKPDNLGNHCFGPNSEAQLCDNGSCSDGGWTTWSSWTSCSTKCGYGIKTQSRSCTNPAPSPHGHYCVGDSIRVDTCHDTTDCSIYSDCSEIKTYYASALDGIYNITLWRSKRSIQVFCDMTTNGGGWTVFQYRYNGMVDFYRTFSEYVKGFGDLHTEYWLGLDYTQEIASRNTNELRIEMIANNGTTAFEEFDQFSLGPSPNYTLHVGKATSSKNIGSTHRFGPYHNGMSFSTYDHDVDRDGRNCAVTFHGAWWYQTCYEANLNGQYFTPGTFDDKGMVYTSFISRKSLKKSKMSFRRSIA